MEFSTLPDEIIRINAQLKEHFGDDLTGKAIWRVSWSNDQTEIRLSKFTKEGVELLFPDTEERKKYFWIRDRWILEQLVIIPEINKNDIPANLQSYECMWVFESPITKEALKPIFEACKFVVDTVHAAMGKKSMAKYVDDEVANPIETKEKRINTLMDELYGDESSLLLRTVTGEAVGYTGEPKIAPVKTKES